MIFSLETRLEQLTEGNTGMQLSVAMSFSGQRDIARAARQIAEKAAQGLLDPAEVCGASSLPMLTYIRSAHLGLVIYLSCFIKPAQSVECEH